MTTKPKTCPTCMGHDLVDGYCPDCGLIEKIEKGTQASAIITIPVRMPKKATLEEIKAQEGPGGCTHRSARVDANLVYLEDTALRVLDVTVRCEKCRHRFTFVGLPLAIDQTQPCVNLRGDIASLPVVLGELDAIKTCQRCHKDHTESGLVCIACSTELKAKNAMKVRVTCRACGHSASYRTSEKGPKKCKRCRSKKIDIDKLLVDMAQSVLADFPEDIDATGLSDAVTKAEKEKGIK